MNAIRLCQLSSLGPKQRGHGPYRALLVAVVPILFLGACSALENAGESDPNSTRANDMLGAVEVHTVRADDTLVDLARDRGLGYVELVAANQHVDPWVPPENAEIVLPHGHILPSAPRKGLVINLADQRLYYFPEEGQPQSFAIGIGRRGHATPLGATKVVAKRRNPTWTPPPSARAEDPSLPTVVPPGPENPLGTRALYLEWPGYLIHGTDKPYGIGRRVSLGCIRLYPEDIEQLFDAIEIGTEVHVVDQPIKVGWNQDELYLEAHPTLRQASELEEEGELTYEHAIAAKELILAAAGDAADRIDWEAVEIALRERRGVPVTIVRNRTWVTAFF